MPVSFWIRMSIIVAVHVLTAVTPQPLSTWRALLAPGLMSVSLTPLSLDVPSALYSANAHTLS